MGNSCLILHQYVIKLNIFTKITFFTQHWEKTLCRSTILKNNKGSNFSNWINKFFKNY